MPLTLLSLPSMAEDLARVEAELRSAVQADDAFLTEMASHLIVAGGKRVRPALVLAAAATGHGVPLPLDVVRGAVAVELVQVGSLYHDDVMDDATTRRTVESVNARWGNLKAIVAGDYLLAKASEIAASLGTEVAGLLAATIAKLCQGQVRELAHTFDLGRDEAGYLASIDGKTASLFSTACRIGAIVVGLDRPDVDTLTSYGRRYGMAFQIVDDILDVTATDEELGKPAGHDLVEGVYTLPVIRTLASGDGDGLRDLLGGPLDGAGLDKARALVRSNPAVAESVAVARSYADEAVAALEALRPGPATDALADAARSLVASVQHL